MNAKPPWVRFSHWANSRERIYELLREAIAVRAEVANCLQDPKANPACRGYVFFHFWVARVAQLAETTPYWRALDPNCGIFTLDDVPIRLYRAPEDAAVPKRVRKVSQAESAQMTIFDFFSSSLDEDGVLEQPNHAIRIRVVTDPKGVVIRQFVFEEIDFTGDVLWEWSVAAGEIPERFEQPIATQPAPLVLPRKRGGKRSDASDE